MSDTVHVRYQDGSAQVRIGDRELSVSRRDDDSRVQSCPLELISVALGS